MPRRGVLSFLLVLSLAAPVPAAAQQPAPRPADVTTLNGIVHAYYDVISGPPGQAREWSRDSSLYIADIRFVSMGFENGRPVPSVMDHGTYARQSDPYFVKNGFFEQEIHRETRRFGNMAHVFSTYESRNSPDGPVIARGINSLNLFWDGTRWWIANATWDEERPDNPLPPEFLPPAGE